MPITPNHQVVLDMRFGKPDTRSFGAKKVVALKSDGVTEIEMKFSEYKDTTWSLSLRTFAPFLFNIYLLRLKIIDEKVPYQFAYFADGTEEWSGSGATALPIVPAQFPEEGSDVTAGMGIRGLAGFVATKGSQDSWSDTSVYCPLRLDHVALLPGKLYKVEFSYRTMAYQPYTPPIPPKSWAQEWLPEPAHLLRIASQSPGGTLADAALFEFPASLDATARATVMIAGVPQARLEFCHRGFGRYYVDNVSIMGAANAN